MVRYKNRIKNIEHIGNIKKCSENEIKLKFNSCVPIVRKYKSTLNKLTKDSVRYHRTSSE